MAEEKKKGWILWLGLAAVLGLLAGCATAPEPADTAKPRSVLLAPTLIDARLGSGLEIGAPAVHRLIAQVLWEQDVQVGTLEGEQFDAIWDSAIRGVSLPPATEENATRTRYDVAFDAVVGALRERGDRFDALLISSLVVRPGSINGGSVWWDGVRRGLPVDARGPYDMLPSFRRGAKTPCVSLRVIAYDANGTRLFERVGGLEVANRISFEGEAGGGHWSKREDLFRDDKALRQGVQLALGPFLRN